MFIGWEFVGVFMGVLPILPHFLGVFSIFLGILGSFLFNFNNLIQIVNEIINSISQSRKVILHDIPN